MDGVDVARAVDVLFIVGVGCVGVFCGGFVGSEVGVFGYLVCTISVCVLRPSNLLAPPAGPNASGFIGSKRIHARIRNGQPIIRRKWRG
jgi:hypothetical protein